MPEMHGLHVLKQIRAGITRQDYEMPVALLTATQDEGCVRYAAALSCDGFILKPITQNTLSTRLEQILHKRMKLPYKPSHYGSVDVGPPDKPPTMKTPAVLGVEDLMVGMVFTKPVIAQSKVIVPSGTEVTHELLELLRNLDRVRPLGAIDAEAR
jgi:DNA-binding response OmpR family regulator